MSVPIRWGILGPGKIAKVFVRELKKLPDARIAAVGSRSVKRAREFAKEWSVERAHGTYEELAADPDVDIVYIGTPHPFHKDNAILCLNNGKPVLCEKPFTINAREAREVIDLARGKKLFLMEAMWTRFLPAIAQVRKWIAEGAIGEPRMVVADFGFRAALNPEGRLFNLELGGGALLDVGVYAVSMASMAFGGAAPVEIRGSAHIGETGVDEQSGMLIRYPEGRLAVLSCAVRTSTPQEASIFGTDGQIVLHSGFWCCKKATLKAGDREETSEVEFEGRGYDYQAAEAMRCLREGKLESAIMPLNESLTIMKTLDELRGQWGLTYPTE
jgi:dihydrodiol dehydrogenase / D-xylose 1-dehydrogenase (NADP)